MVAHYLPFWAQNWFAPNSSEHMEKCVGPGQAWPDEILGTLSNLRRNDLGAGLGWDSV